MTMKKKLVQGFELLIYAVIVGGLLWVAFFVTPPAQVSNVQPSLFGGRTDYYGVAAVDGDGVWLVGSGGHIVRSGDGGKTWRQQPTKVNVNLQDIVAWNPQTAIVIGDESTVLRTTDGGQHWQQIKIPSRKFGKQLLHAYVQKGTHQAWITGAYGTVLKTDDQGATWKMAYPAVDHAWNDITQAPGGGLWLVGEFGSMAHSVDDGASWSKVKSQSKASLMSVAFANATDGVAVGLNGTVTHTTDGGQSWALVPTKIKSHLFDVIWTGTRYVAVGDDGVIGYANAAGGKWKFSTLGHNDFGWYTGVATGPAGAFYLAGVLPGVLQHGTWRKFEDHDGAGQ